LTPLAATWSALEPRRRILAVAATVAVFLAVLGLARMSAAPQMALLYSGLDPAAAGEVVAALEARGIAHVVEGDAIRVDAAQRDSLRMALAAEGLPAGGPQGYELLDGLSGFATTAQMFDAAYWRAKEGELARTILAVPGVRAARVHIAQAPDAPFRSEGRPTASVTLTALPGSLGPLQVRALRHLVASAVPGLAPADVAVIDSVAGLLENAEEAALPAVADQRAAELRASVERLLAARVGPGRVAVEVAVDLVSARESVVERRFDPQGRVAISTETEERSDQSTAAAAGVTVASNLPEGDAAAGEGDRSQSSQTRERTNFEVSETQREVLRLPGDIRRLTVAVLVDGERVTAADGSTTWQPRSEAELADLRDLVASAVGLDEARGDVLTLKSLPFDVPAAAGTPAEADGASALAALDPLRLIQLATLAGVALGLGLFVLRPVLLAALRRPEPPPLPPPPLALPAAAVAGGVAVDGEIEGPGAGLPAEDAAAPAEDPVTRLRRLIEERRAESVEILRSWMERDEEKV
jgi:flagellar M-ring protein FliF